MIVYKIVSKTYKEILPLLFWVLLLFGFDKAYIAVLTLLVALVHEVGHYIAFLADCQQILQSRRGFVRNDKDGVKRESYPSEKIL